MKLRSKVIGILIAITVFFLIVDYTIQRKIIFPTYITLEKAAVVENLQRVKEAITNEIEHLDTLCIDWAFWDDTYNYVEDRNKDYEQSNLVVETFITGKLNLIMFVDPAGKLIAQNSYDFNTEQEIDLESILANPNVKQFLLKFHGAKENLHKLGSKGLLFTTHGAMLIAARPILTSENLGPTHGTLIMGRIFDEDAAAVIRKQIKVDFTMETIEEVLKRQKGTEIVNAITPASPFVVRSVDNDKLAAHTIIQDLLGHPALFIEVLFPREITRIGLISIRYAVVFILLAGAIAMGSLAYFINKMILHPLLMLERLMVNVHENADYSLRANIKSKDEIGTLAHGFNAMLEKTETQKAQLDLFIQDLQTEIHKRAVIEKQLKLANDELENMARRDPLTRLANRRHFDEVYTREWQRQRRNGNMLSIIMCDIDHFKKINDRYGHQQGDVCLQQVAKTLETQARRSIDCIARYGGEEFIVLLPETSAEDAVIVAENMRKAIEDQAIPNPDSTHGNIVTLSLGVAGSVPSDNISQDELAEMADKALYKAKEKGRNCTVLFPTHDYKSHS